MSNYTINLKVENDNIFCDRSFLTADSINYITAKFTFDESWQRFIKTAIFRLGESVYHVVLENDECTVPYEVLAAPIMHISVFGVVDNLRATTSEVAIQVKKSGYVIMEPSEPTPDPYNYFIQKATELKDAAAKAAELSATYAEEINPSNYYTKAEVDSMLATLTSRLNALDKGE